MNRHPIVHRVPICSLRPAPAWACIAGTLMLAGCYERTVNAKGLGATNSTVQQGYRSDTALDRAWDSMFSDPRESKPVPRNPGATSR